VSAAFSSALKYDTCVKRDLYTSKETYRQRLRTKNYGLSGHICALSSAQRYDAGVKRDVYTSKETYIHEKRPIHIKRDPSKRPIHRFPFSSALRYDACVKRHIYTSKETYTHQKRPTKLKRDLHTTKENIQRDLWTFQTYSTPHLRRSGMMNLSKETSKETYIHVKRLINIKRDP